MPTVVYPEGRLQIPIWVRDLASFRRWAESDEFPEEGRVCFINGEVWADMSRQQIFSHLAVKHAIDLTVGSIVQQTGAGRYLPDGLRLYSKPADLSAVPDGSYISYDALRSGRVRLVKGRKRGFTAVEGAPELVVEIISDTSLDKDYDWQMQAYHDAGVREYWVIDARGESLDFDIYKSGAKGFTAVRQTGGWLKSPVLGKSFRFDVSKDPIGHPNYVLRVK